MVQPPFIYTNGMKVTILKTALSKKHIIELLGKAHENDIDSIKTENLYSFNGKAAYSLGQGQ